MKFLILGRTATGKDTLANILMSKYNWTFIKSMTDRPKRTEAEDTHIFISTEEFTLLSPSEIIAETCINNYHYCATKKQLMENDAYIVDPHGCYQLLENCPDEHFILVYMKAKDKLQQQSYAIQRSNNIYEESIIFQQRYESEDSQFIDFENMIEICELFKYPNVVHTIYYLNIYDEESINLFSESLNRLKQHLK